jgi:hypothetical protein
MTNDRVQAWYREAVVTVGAVCVLLAGLEGARYAAAAHGLVAQRADDPIAALLGTAVNRSVVVDGGGAGGPHLLAMDVLYKIYSTTGMLAATALDAFSAPFRSAPAAAGHGTDATVDLEPGTSAGMYSDAADEVVAAQNIEDSPPALTPTESQDSAAGSTLTEHNVGTITDSSDDGQIVTGPAAVTAPSRPAAGASFIGSLLSPAADASADDAPQHGAASAGESTAAQSPPQKPAENGASPDADHVSATGSAREQRLDAAPPSTSASAGTNADTKAEQPPQKRFWQRRYRVRIPFTKRSMNVLSGWLIAIGLIVVIMGCCVLYAMRQVTVLRETVDELRESVVDARTDMNDSDERRRKETVQMTEQLRLQQPAEIADVGFRVKSVEKDMLSQRDRLSEYILNSQRAEQQRSDARARQLQRHDELQHETHRDNNATSDTTDVLLQTFIAQGGNDTANDMTFAPPTAALAPSSPKRSLMRNTAQGDAEPAKTFTSSQGLSFTVPPRAWIYERVHSNTPRDCILKKRLHSVSLGAAASNGEVHDVTLLFSSVESVKQHGGDGLPAMELSAATPGVTAIPSNTITQMDIRDAPREFVECMGSTAGAEGGNLLVTVHSIESGRHQTLLQAAPATASASSFRDAAHSNSAGQWSNAAAGGSAAAGQFGDVATPDRNFFRARRSVTGGGAAARFVFFLPGTPAAGSDAWVNFMMQLLGDRVKMGDDVGGHTAISVLEL